MERLCHVRAVRLVITCGPCDRRGVYGIGGPIHPTAVPVLLTMPEEWSTWLAAPTEIALELQRPLPDAQMRIVA